MIRPARNQARGGSVLSIRSAYLDGTDSRVLLSGCVATSLVVPRPDGGGQIASAEGFALRCQGNIVMVDLDTLVTTAIVSGPTSDYGLYFPH